MRLDDLLQRRDLPEDVIAFAREELAARELQAAQSPPSFDWLHAAEALLACLPGPAFVKDRHSRFLLANAHVAETTTAPTANVSGHTDFDLYPPDEAQQHFEEEQHLLCQGVPLASVERTYVDADGRRRWYVTRKLPFRDASGQTVGLVGYNHEPTDLHRA